LLKREEISALVARAVDGETEVFSALVEAHLDAAYLTALAIVGRPSDAEDIAQDAFLVAFERLESCREPARFSGWLLRIVRTRALNWIDRRRRHETTGEQGLITNPAPLPEPTDVGLRRRLLEALSGLTPAQREVILLHELEGWSHAEIAEATDGSEMMCRQHLVTARRKLRERLVDLSPLEVEHGR
jgi:RNA polymerase sigma-70 factor, ECF subfamily